MFLEDSQIFHLQFLKIEDYIQNFCHKFHIHNFYEPNTELRSEKLIFIIYSSIFHSQSWKTACFAALGQENRFSNFQTMNFFFSAWNENSTIIKENLLLDQKLTQKSEYVHSTQLRKYVSVVVKTNQILGFHDFSDQISNILPPFPPSVHLCNGGPI